MIPPLFVIWISFANVYFQQDGVPSHISNIVMELCTDTFFDCIRISVRCRRLHLHQVFPVTFSWGMHDFQRRLKIHIQQNSDFRGKIIFHTWLFYIKWYNFRFGNKYMFLKQTDYSWFESVSYKSHQIITPFMTVLTWYLVLQIC